jgi:hypothetical protein
MGSFGSLGRARRVRVQKFLDPTDSKSWDLGIRFFSLDLNPAGSIEECISKLPDADFYEILEL